MSLPNWVVCPHGEWVWGGTTPSFPPNPVKIVTWTSQDIVRTWRIGANQKWDTYAEEHTLS